MHTHIHTNTQTNLFLVADPVSTLQAFIQKGQAQLVYGRFIEIIFHKTATDTVKTVE